MIYNKKSLTIIILLLSAFVVLLSLKILSFNKSFSDYERKMRSRIEKMKERTNSEISYYKTVNRLTKILINRKLPFNLKSKRYGNYLKKEEISHYFVFISNTEECLKCKKRYYNLLKKILEASKNKKTGVFIVADYNKGSISKFYLSDEDVPVFFVKREAIKNIIGTEDFTVILWIDNNFQVVDIYKPVCLEENIRRFVRWAKEKM